MARAVGAAVLCASCAQAGAPTASPTLTQVPSASAPAAAAPAPAAGIAGPRPVPTDPLTGDVYPTPGLDGWVRERREIHFESSGVPMVGELDLPFAEAPPLAFIVHHSGPVARDAYGYLAEILTRAGYAVMRFDKRGTGASGGVYGCCEADDMLAAYAAVLDQTGFDACRVFVVAQSIGTTHVAERFAQMASLHRPQGVILLSSLLRPQDILAISAPIHIVVSDSEPDLDAISRAAAQAHRAEFSSGATYYVAKGSEHTLFDVSSGPIDWSDPSWVTRYHRGAMRSVVDWLNSQRSKESDCA